MNTINKLISAYNHNEGDVSRIKYIVIHYVGALGGAKANCQYYGGGDRQASAHYFVGFDGEIWQCVEDANVAWHCGANSYVHPECRNANSIGIEMCVRKRNTASLGAEEHDWYFEDATVSSAVELTKYLMNKYGVPADHVIRHYDVTGKICPNPYVYNDGNHTWSQFKTSLSGGSLVTQELYRVRKSWDDTKSQIGAYANLDNAKNACTNGYIVITVPFLQDYRVAGVLAGVIYEQDLRSMLISEAYGNEGYSFIADTKGNVIVSTNSEQ